MNRPAYSPLWLGFTLLVIALATVLGPAERTLGANLRLVLLHGGLVWAGKIAFAAAALTGLTALILRRKIWHDLSLALGRTGLIFWLVYLPMSLLVQIQNWGGIFWDEPRWRVPFTFGVVAVLLQLGLWIMKRPALSSAANLVFGALLWWQLGGITNVLHPDSPVFSSSSADIPIFFLILLGLCLLAAAQITWLLYRSLTRNEHTGTGTRNEHTGAGTRQDQAGTGARNEDTGTRHE